MQEPKYYRAKLQFQTRKFKNQVKAGLYAQNSHYLVELKDCLVQDKETQVIANRLAELLTYHQIPITDERKRSVFAPSWYAEQENGASSNNHCYESSA